MPDLNRVKYLKQNYQDANKTLIYSWIHKQTKKNLFLLDPTYGITMKNLLYFDASPSDVFIHFKNNVLFNTLNNLQLTLYSLTTYVDVLKTKNITIK